MQHRLDRDDILLHGHLDETLPVFPWRKSKQETRLLSLNVLTAIDTTDAGVSACRQLFFRGYDDTANDNALAEHKDNKRGNCRDG